MKFVRFNYALYSLLVTIIVAFSAQIAVSLADPEYQEVVNQLAPVFGVALGILLVGGYRYIPWIFWAPCCRLYPMPTIGWLP